MNGHTEEERNASCEYAFDQFVTAVTCKSILASFYHLLDTTGLRHVNHAHFYEKLKAKLKGSWKAQSLWVKLDKRASHRDYKKGQACSNLRVLIIGSGPCGLRTAIECALLGAKTVVVEKRDRFSRNNVLHLWPFLITDLRNLSAKKFFGKFCAGAIDHISIRQLQCILLKVALLLGVEVHVNVTFEGLIEPPEDQSSGVGWKCKVTPENHAVSEYEFDALFSADGKRNTLSGFRRKEFRGKLAIAVTANFINRNTQAEARVQEISGVAFIFNQKFFTDLKETTQIDLENIVYYKDDTHYFVMTAKKASLLEKGVLKEDYSDTLALLDRSNVDQERLMEFARAAANFSTNYQLPSLDYAVNHYGQADVAMFDFTSMFAAENASRCILKNGHHLLMGLVGDSLLEPFWPTGSGCARGFLGAFDAAWMIRSWAMGKTALQVLAERESIYTVLSQTTPNYLNKNHNMFSLDPNTRYPNLNLKAVKPSQVRHLYEGGVFDANMIEEEDLALTVPAKKPRNADISSVDSYSLLRWCQRVLNTGKYRDVHVVDFTSSWRSGLALCALIHSFRPDIINNTALLECDAAANNQLAFNIAEKELGIPPVLTGEDMAKYEVPDKLTMVSYLAQFYDHFKLEPLPSSMPVPVKAKRKSMSKEVIQPKAPHSPSKRTSFFQKLSAKLAKSKKRKEQEENERSILGSKKLKEREEKSEVELTRYNKLPMDEIANRLQLDRKTDVKVDKTEERSGAVSVTVMADLLVAKFKSQESKPPPEPVRRLKGQPSLLAASAASEFCSFCHKRVYIMERMSAEGEFFHRGCLKCDHCSVGLRLTNYSCDRDAKPVKFYCYRHAIPELRTRPQRKRGLEEEVKENVPDVVVTPPPDHLDTAPKEKTPRKGASTHLTPLSLPKDGLEQSENTPERVEFEISFDGQEEESEEEQFEHNLRASLSSETLLDDEDSDSELSDSEMESDAEDEVWENAVESFKSPHTPLTLEEACELHGNWRRQHSHENLLNAGEDDRTPSRGQPLYSRLLGENGDEEDSSTEVEEGSEYETDDSSAEDDSEEDKTEPAHGASADDHTEMSLNSPSPVSRISASKASFFSEPPKVVSLDPWSMFGMGKKAAEKEMEVTENVPEELKLARKKSNASGRKKSSASDKKRSSASESRSASGRKKSTDSKKDTDVSVESLELDFKSTADKGEGISPAGSLDELKEDFTLDVMADEVCDQRMDNVEQVESIEKDIPQLSILNKSEKKVEEVQVPDKEREKEVDDRILEDADEDEMFEKTALSRAMEQLLQEIDHKKSPSSLTSDSDENEIFLEGRLSPSANKTRKHHVKHRKRHSKELQKSQPANSDSEAGRTDPTSTDSSRPRSIVSQSPSLESTDDLLPCDRAAQNSVTLINDPKPESNEKKDADASQQSLEKTESLLFGSEQDDESLQQVLESIAAMPDLSDNSDIDDLVFSNVDDKFVTKRHKKPTKKSSSRSHRKVKQESSKGVLDFSNQKDASVNNSFSISAHSDSESSLICVDVNEFAGQVLEIKPGDDDIKPDQHMLKDYATTISLVLGESYSDEMEKSPEEKDSAHEFTGQVEIKPSEDDIKPDQDMLKDYATTISLVLGESYSDEMEKSPEEKYSTKEFAGQVVEIKPSKNDIKPDQDMLKDYATTISLVLGESCSDEIEEKSLGENEFVQKTINISDRNDLAEAEHADKTEQSGLAEASETTADISSLYMTPDASLEKQKGTTADSSTPKSASTPRPLPVPRYQVPAHQPQKPAAAITVPTSSNTLSASTPSHKQDNRDSSGSDIFLSPVENISQSSFVDKPSPLISLQAPSLPHRPETIAALPQHSISNKDSDNKNKPFSSLSTTRPSDTTKETPNSTAGRSQRKMPELPKLIIPAKQTTQQSKKDISPDQPIMCSSPKLGSKVAPRISTSNRVLPVLNTTNKTPHIRDFSVADMATTSKSSSSAIKNGKFAKPASPPPKTRVPIDRSKLKLGSSSDPPDSDHEIEAKKKISAEGIVINHTFGDDIPFADESEAEEKFYTPCAPGRTARPAFPSGAPSSLDHADARKKILPNLPAARDTSKSAKEKPTMQTEIKGISKMDEKRGANIVGPSHSAALVLRRQPSDKSIDSHSRLSASYDTNDTLSDRDDNMIQSVTTSATEGDHMSQSTFNKAKKSRAKAKKTKKKHRDKKPITQDNVKPLTTPKRPGHTFDSGSNNNNVCLSSNSTPKGSEDNLEVKMRVRTLHVNNTSDKKAKTFKMKSDAWEDVDKTPTSESKRDLAICSVFHSEASNRQSRGLLSVSTARKTLSVAPKASADEMSDSDESHISLSTMQRRRDEDLDERVARRLRKIQQKQHKRAEQKRLRMAQEIQRQLEEVEVRQRELEERGISVEKALRGDDPDAEDVDEGQLMSEWFTLVHEKNALLRYESELNVRAKELELEDRQARLEFDFRERSKQPAKSGGLDLRHHKKETKTEKDIAAEGHLLDELLNVVEQRNNLVAMLEEDRLREQKEDSNLKEVMTQKGFVLSPLSFDTRRKKIEAPLATYAL